MVTKEVAEYITDIVYGFSIKKGIPKWPVVPFSSEIFGLWDELIQTNVDILLLKKPLFIAQPWNDICSSDVGVVNNFFVVKYYIPSVKKIRSHYNKIGINHIPIILEWYDFIPKKAKKLGTFLYRYSVCNGVEFVCSMCEKQSFYGNRSFCTHGGYRTPGLEKGILLAPGIKLAMEASWSVRLRLFEDNASVDVPTNKEGVYALFRDRNCNGSRRKALLHWVKEHCRIVGDKDVKVVSHLRGVHRFDWRGIDVRITPPVDSLERAEMGIKIPPSVLNAIERYRKLQIETRECL